MKVIVTTSNKYVSLLGGYAELFNRHWSKDQEVVVLCYDEPKMKLPGNFTIHSLGKQEDFGTTYTDAVIPFFDTLKDEYFVIVMEDHFLVQDVDLDLVKKAEKEILSNGVDKVWLGCWMGNDNHPIKNHSNKTYSEDFFEFSQPQQGKYYMGSFLDPSLWTSKLWSKLISPGLTLHQVEGHGVDICKQINPKVLFPRRRVIYNHLDAARHGGFNINSLEEYEKDPDGGLGAWYCGSRIDRNDIDVFYQSKKDFENHE